MSCGVIRRKMRFSFKNEAAVLAIISFGLPAIGLIALFLLWLLGRIPD